MKNGNRAARLKMPEPAKAEAEATANVAEAEATANVAEARAGEAAGGPGRGGGDIKMAEGRGTLAGWPDRFL
jgi:hypothetical protein